MCTEAHALPTITHKVMKMVMKTTTTTTTVNEKMEVDGSEEQHPVSSSGLQLYSHPCIHTGVYTQCKHAF